MPTAVIIGATGLIGRSVLHLCMEDTFFDKIITITRGQIGLKHAKLQEMIVPDFSQLENISIDPSNELFAFCCLGTTRKKAGSKALFKLVDHDYVLSFAKKCKELGVKHLSIVSSLGASHKSLSFYSRTKGLMESNVQSLNLTSCSFLRPSLLLGQRNEARFAEDLAKKLPLSFLGPWKPIDGFDVAKAMIHIAEAHEPGVNFFSSGDLKIIADSI